jgi:hypothetical protein
MTEVTAFSIENGTVGFLEKHAPRLETTNRGLGPKNHSTGDTSKELRTTAG